MIGIKDNLDKLPGEIHLDPLDENSPKAYIAYLIMGDYEWMCAYVVVPMKVTDIRCHGGVTYGEDSRNQFEIPEHEDIEIPEGYHVLGWDFNHFNDSNMTVTRAFCSVRETLMWLFERGIRTL